MTGNGTIPLDGDRPTNTYAKLLNFETNVGVGR